ncbi:hypothetical protein [Jiella marina]|uniref:hypothetical protein n=1 Tax=Jiella sp. LLJ827 TaxID=2917712 RepID=UPI0021019168|nr:hypothetical protein [Jiella sp. LLJ827]MCQ0990313.1 hypothetical protein [Jiella sp. LLJ827]
MIDNHQIVSALMVMPGIAVLLILAVPNGLNDFLTSRAYGDRMMPFAVAASVFVAPLLSFELYRALAYADRHPRFAGRVRSWHKTVAALLVGPLAGFCLYKILLSPVPFVLHQFSLASPATYSFQVEEKISERNCYGYRIANERFFSNTLCDTSIGSSILGGRVRLEGLESYYGLQIYDAIR